MNSVDCIELSLSIIPAFTEMPLNANQPSVFAV